MKLNNKNLYQKYKSEFETLKGLDLLRKIEQISEKIYDSETDFESVRIFLGNDDKSRKRMKMAVVQSNFEGIEEYTDKFYEIYQFSSQRQNIIRDFIMYELESDRDCGFSEYDSRLIIGSAKISKHYDNYYLEWAKEARNSKAAKVLLDMISKNPKELEKIVKAKDFHNNYTVIKIDENNELYDEPYYQVLSKQIDPIASEFESLITELTNISNLSEEQNNLIEYLRKYRDCLVVDDRSVLEKNWKELDEIWMNVRYHIQIVHDIEYGYGDPLRTKAIPDFSIRFLDDQYKKENQRIDEIRKLMMMYFSKRDSQLAKDGLYALDNSMAGIYYIPFQCGMSLHFRFSGQSIPNRPDVKAEKGVKIYFDPVSTEMRTQMVKDLIDKVFIDKSLKENIDAIDIIVNHVAAHEFGHAIYNLKALEGTISVATESLLEEARAELTAVRTMKLMRENGMLTEENYRDTFFSFVASDLRRFAMYNSSSTRPYTISALNVYKVYEESELLIRDGEQLKVDPEKINIVIDSLSDQFEKILDSEDREDGEFLEQTLEDMQEVSDLTEFLVERLDYNE